MKNWEGKPKDQCNKKSPNLLNKKTKRLLIVYYSLIESSKICRIRRWCQIYIFPKAYKIGRWYWINIFSKAHRID